MNMKIDDKASVMANPFGFDLYDASERLKDEKDLVLAILEVNPSAFRYASDRLKDDEEVVMAAKHNLDALMFASERIRDNEKIILAFLLNTTEEAMGLASDRLRSDIDFCIECAKINSGASYWFEGEAEELFEKYDYDLEAIQNALPKYKEEKANEEQQKANEALLAQIKKSPTTTTPPSFKMNIISTKK